jgi:hypothetical protein
MRRDKSGGERREAYSAQLTACRYWGCGLGFAVLFITLIDLMHRNLAPTFATRIPRVRGRCFRCYYPAPPCGS